MDGKAAEKTHLKRSRCKREERKDERKSDRKRSKKKNDTNRSRAESQRVPPAFGNSRNKKMRWRFNPVTKKERKKERGLSLVSLYLNTLTRLGNQLEKLGQTVEKKSFSLFILKGPRFQELNNNDVNLC